MAGTPEKRARLRIEAEAEMYELGLLDIPTTCISMVKRTCHACLLSETGSCGRVDCERVECGRPLIDGRLRCIAHRHEDVSAKHITSTAEILREMRFYIANQLLPKAVGAIEDVLDDEQATHADRMKAAVSAMDRIGLPAGQQIQMETVVTVVPPAEALRATLEGIRSRMESAGVVAPGETAALGAPAGAVVPGEVTEGPEAAQPATVAQSAV